ncbi:MAG TPA: riboflavin synthase [Gammaproteobacteria bacterium]|nr:riboflavin synthase [Gammaproteobacteria bacterium]
MFTGIVTCAGTLRDVQASGDEHSIVVGTPALDAQRRREGDSVAVQGVCLTVREAAADGFRADLSAETLRSTTLGRLARGDQVNIEPALRLGEPLGGHLVTGHVDGVGRVVERREGRSVRLFIEAPAPLAGLIAVKGSICVDGVSLTVNEVEAARFRVDIVPHTLAVTSLAGLRPQDTVNLEVDLVARYLARYLEVHG